MGFKKKAIDNKQFEDFFTEARAKIPSLSPDWTDHNLSDPGITILELLSWVNEVNLYKASIINDIHEEKLIQLYGFKRRNVRPSLVWLKFSTGTKNLFIKRGYDIQTVSGNKLINFKTLNSVYVNTSKIKKIVFYSKEGYRSVPPERIPEGFYLFGSEAETGNTFYIGFTTLSSGGITLGFILDKEVMTEFKKERFIPDVEIRWSVLTSDGWREIKPKLDTTDCLYRSGIVSFKIPGDINLEKSKIPLNSEEELHFIRCKLTKGTYDNPAQIRYLSSNFVPAVQVKDVTEHIKIKEVYPEFEIKLSKRFITDKEVRLVINSENWREVQEIKHYSHKDAVFYINREKGILRFGDGINGKLPDSNTELKVIYRFSYGNEGNIKAGSKWITDGELSVENPFSGKNGLDPEKYKDVFRRIKEDISIPYTCVTLKDYEFIAFNTPDIKIARVKGYRVKNKNRINIYVLPFSEKKKPVPTKKYLNYICKHIDKHRLITTKIRVLKPEYTEISVIGKIVIKENANPDNVKSKVLETLDNFFHPVKGGKNKKGWDFGQTVYISDLYSVIEKIEGVDGVIELTMYAGKGVKKTESGNIYLLENYIPVSGNHKIYINEKTETCRR